MSRNKYVAIVSLLPPPAGGIASWTEKLFRLGLPDGFVPVLVDQSYRSDRPVFAAKINILEEIRRSFAVVADLVRTIVVYRPVVVHLNCHLSRRGVFRDAVCAAVTRCLRTPLVTHYRGDISRFPSGAAHDIPLFVLKAIMRSSHVNVALTSASAQYVRDIATSNCVKLPNFIEDEVLQARPARRNRERLRIIYAGGITRAKGAIDICQIALQLPEADFVLVGNHTSDFVEEIKSENLRVFRELNREALLQEMVQSDILLFPSYSEGFPNTVLEAMAMALPVVAARTGAIPDMIEEGKGGMLREPGDVPGFISALRQLIYDPDLRCRMGRFNWEKCETQYAYSIVARQLVGLYETLMSKASVATV